MPPGAPRRPASRLALPLSPRLTPEQEHRFALVRQLDSTTGAALVLVGSEVILVDLLEAEVRGWSPLLTSDEVASMGLAHLDDGTLSVPGTATAVLLLAERVRLAQAVRPSITSAA